MNSKTSSNGTKQCITKKPEAKSADEGSPLLVEIHEKGRKPEAGITVDKQDVIYFPAEGPDASPKRDGGRERERTQRQFFC